MDNFLSDRFEWVDTPRFDLDSAISLLCVLANKKNHMRVAKDFPFLYADPDGSECVNKLSDELVGLLSSLEKRASPDIARLWVERGGWMKIWHESGMFPMEDIEKRLMQLRDVSKKALKKISRYCYINLPNVQHF